MINQMELPEAYAVFARTLNTSFNVTAGEDSVEIKLAELSELQNDNGQQRFSLMFLGPLNSFVPQGTYQFRHETAGEFLLFIVPIGKDAEGFRYQAVFNRLQQNV